jgi:micrococcal nuclease
MGKAAARFTKNLVEARNVRLEFDVERRDKYGRLLAYVYLEDGTFVNAKIVEEGYAQVMTIPPNVKYAQLFLKLQQDARSRGAGLWKAPGSDKELF